MTSNPKKGKREDSGAGRREWRRAVILMVLAAIMVLAAAAVVLYNRWFQRPDLPSADEPTLESGAPDQGERLDSVQPKVSGERKSRDFYTILVFGPDETSGLTDVMMLVSYDVTNQQATVMSFPRDTLINSSGKSVSQKMLNAVYNRYGGGEAGVEGLKTEMSELVGFVPDYYVEIDWRLIGEMVEAIGGVWFDIPYHLDYDDPYQDLHIHFEPGYQYLNGEDAMKVMRWRKNNEGSPYGNPGGGSDISRIEMRNDFLKAVLSQTLQLKNVTKIGELSRLFGENVKSDLTIENLFWFGSQAILGGLAVEDVNFVVMPFRSVGESGVYYYRVYPDQQPLLELINQSLNPFVDEVTLDELDLISVSADGNTLSSSTGVLADPSAGYHQPSPAPSQSQEPSPSVQPEPDPEPTPSQEEPGPDPSRPAGEEPEPSQPIPEPEPDPEPSQPEQEG